MHSGRQGTGPGQSHNNNHPQQQSQNQVSRGSSSSGSSSASPVSTAASHQSAMLSAGQPSVPSGIFRTGADNPPPSLRFAASGSYVPAQYSSIYGIHSQSPGHATTLQPYSTFFPSFGGSSATGHSFCHGASMPGAGQSHYPQIESYSAMLASMGSRVQHHGAQGTDRTSRMQAPGVPGSQQMNTFLSPAPILVASAGPYASMQPTTRPHCPDSRSHTRSPSPGPSSSIHNAGSTSILQDSLSAHHLDKLPTRKGSFSLHGRERDVREMRLYGNASSLRDERLTLSPGSYSGSGHVPKVSFDSVVKEYGGGGDCPAGRGDLYTRTSLSGKEGSLKHRILVRPSDSDVPEELSTMTNIHGLKDQPSPKRAKMSASASSSYSHQHSLENPNNHQEPDAYQLHKPHPTSHRGVSKNSSGVSRRIEANDSLDTVSAEYSFQQHVPYHEADSQDKRTDNGLQQHHYDSPSTRPSESTSLPSPDQPSNLQYPSHFLKGSIIQLANGTLKRVEDLKTEDFVNSAEISADLKVDSSTVVKIEEHIDEGTAMLSFCVGEHRVPVTVEATLEHPFFVFGQGWCSCSVSRTLARYGLDCQKLNVGDVCISLTHKDVSLKAAEISQQQEQQSSTPEQHYKFTMTSSPDTPKHLSPSPPDTSLSPHPAMSESPSSTASSHQLEHTRTDSQSPASVSTLTTKRPPSRADLPPPSSNIVLVKRDNNNSSHKRDFNRAACELIQKESADDDDSDSVASLRKRRQSVSDHSAAKADFEREKDTHLGSGVAEKNEEEMGRAGAGNNGHH